MTPEPDYSSEHRPHRHHSGGHRHHRKRSRKPSFFEKLSSGFQSIGETLTGTRGHRRPKVDKPPLSFRLKLRWQEFKAEFKPPEKIKKGVNKHEPLRKRIKTHLSEAKSDLLIPRIKKEKLPKPKLSIRLGMKMDEMKDDLTFRRLFPKVGDRIPRKAKLAYIRETKWKQYSVIFSKEFLTISFNSLIFFLAGFYTVHFISQLVTGLFCSFFNIQTELFYSTTEYHFTINSVVEGQVIMNKWTLFQIITVFSSAPVVDLILAVFAFRLLNAKRIKFSFKKMFRKFRNLFAGKKKRQALKLEEKSRDHGKRINIPGFLRLFLMWFMVHAFTYFFSGMIFTKFFFMRFGYVTGYIFDSNFFDNLFALLSVISMILLGMLFTATFLHSSRIYFNQLVDWTRMPFVVNQIIFPTLLGLPVIALTLLPKIILKIFAMQLCMVILILPLMWRGRVYPEIQFDYKPRKVRVFWLWIIVAILLSGAMIAALKMGINMG